MTTPSGSRVSRAAQPPCPDHDRTLSRSAFNRRLACAVDACEHGAHCALAELELARAQDIERTCGRGGRRALRKWLRDVVSSALDDDAVLGEVSPCRVAILLEGCSPGDALAVAERVREAVRRAEPFDWHGHPFRLGAHLGLVELGSEPPGRAPQVWLKLAHDACVAADQLGGRGLQLVEFNGHAWTDIDREREWHEHLQEVLA